MVAPKPMKPFTLALALAIISTQLIPSLHAEELALKPLEPIIKELIESPNPDPSELAYASARGAALFLALSAYIEANPRSDGSDKQIVVNFKTLWMAYFRVASILGRSFSKTEDATVEQVKILSETYAKKIVASKQLNNEIFSPAIRKDIAALKLIESTVLEISGNVDGRSAKPQSK